MNSLNWIHLFLLFVRIYEQSVDVWQCQFCRQHVNNIHVYYVCVCVFVLLQFGIFVMVCFCLVDYIQTLFNFMKIVSILNNQFVNSGFWLVKTSLTSVLLLNFLHFVVAAASVIISVWANIDVNLLPCSCFFFTIIIIN